MGIMNYIALYKENKVCVDKIEADSVIYVVCCFMIMIDCENGRHFHGFE